MPGGWGPGAWTSSGGQEPFTAGSYTSGNGNGNGNGDGDGSGPDEIFDDTVVNEGIVLSTGQIINPTNLDDDIWNLATQAYESNPGYALSWKGQKLIEQLAANTTNGQADPILPGDPRYKQEMAQAFGLPNIVATGTYTWGEPMLTTEGGNPIMSGQGQYLMDQYDQPGTYEDKVAQYYSQQAEQEQRARMLDQGQEQAGYGYGYDPGGGGGYAGGPGSWIDVKRFSRGRPENISQWARNIAGTPMLPVAGSGAGGSLAAADELYALAAGKKAFSMTPKEQGILALLNA